VSNSNARLRCSLPTTLPLQYDPSLMAKAIIYVVCSLLKVQVVSDGETFAERFDIDPEKLRGELRCPCAGTCPVE
jgi:hypothetical protein